MLVTPVTPFRIFNSAAVDVTSLSLLISFPLAVIATVPSLRELTVACPDVVREPSTERPDVENVNKSVLSVCPIVEPFIVTLDTLTSEPVILSVVVILSNVLIVPKLLPIEPLVNVPTVFISLPPLMDAYKPSACVSVKRLLICVWMLLFTSDK